MDSVIFISTPPFAFNTRQPALLLRFQALRFHLGCLWAVVVAGRVGCMCRGLVRLGGPVVISSPREESQGERKLFLPKILRGGGWQGWHEDCTIVVGEFLMNVLCFLFFLLPLTDYFAPSFLWFHFEEARTSS
jgi:hypothetical protein